MSARTRASTASPPLAITGRSLASSRFRPWRGTWRAGSPGSTHGLSRTARASCPCAVPLRGGPACRASPPSSPGTAPAHDYKEVMVEVGRVDDLDVASLGLVKIDVEGHELEVVEGARKRAAARPAAAHRGDRGGSAPGQLGPCPDLPTRPRLRGFFLQAGRLEALGSRRITDVQGEKLAGRGAYIYNFVFVHLLMAGRAADCASAATSRGYPGLALRVRSDVTCRERTGRGRVPQSVGAGLSGLLRISLYQATQSSGSRLSPLMLVDRGPLDGRGLTVMLEVLTDDQRGIVAGQLGIADAGRP